MRGWYNRRFLSSCQEVQTVSGESSGESSASLSVHSTEQPFPRSGHRMVANSSHLFVLGGYNPDLWDQEQDEDSYYPLFRELWLFNTLTKKWRRLETHAEMPVELASHSVSLHDKYLLVFGGTGVPFGHSSSNDLHVCNLQSFDWSVFPAASNPRPQKEYGHAMVRDEFNVYVVGGTTGFVYNMEVFRLDLSCPMPQWSNISSSPEPPARYRHEVILHEGKLLIFAGGTSDEVFGLDKLDAFDIAAKQWSVVQTKPSISGFPGPRRCHSLVKYKNFVTICGGYNGVRIFSDIWQLNLDTFRWTKMKAVLPKPCFFHDAAVTPEGCMYVYGGVTNPNSTVRTSKIYRVWLTVPTLALMCLEKLLSLNPKLTCLSKDELVKLGIPFDYVDRITT